MGSDPFSQNIERTLWGLATGSIRDATSSLTRARALLREGESERALDVAQKILRIMPEHGQTTASLGVRASALAISALARNAMDSSRERAGGDTYASEALAAFRELLRENVELDDETLQEAIEAFLLASDSSGAAEVALSALRTGKGLPPDLILRIVSVLDRAEHDDLLNQLLETARSRYPDHVEIAIWLANIAHKQWTGSDQAASADLEAARLLIAESRFREAESHLRRSLNAVPTSPSALAALLVLLFQQGKVQEGIDAADTYNASASEAVEVVAIQVLLLAAAGRVDDALTVGRGALQRISGATALLVSILVRLLMAADRSPDASSLLEEHLQAEPDDPQLLYAKAELLRQENELAPAAEILRGLVQQYPNLGQFRVALIRVLMDSSQLSEALTVLTSSDASLDALEGTSELREELVQSSVNYAHSHFYDDDTSGVKTLLETVIVADPESLTAHRLLADMLRRESKWDVALLHLDRAESLLRKAGADSWVTAWVTGTRGQILAAKGQHREAMELFQRAISIDASQGWLLVEAADMLRVLGDSRQAVAYASRAIQLDAKDSWAWAVRGSAELELGAYSEALVSLNLALDVIPDYGWALLVKSQVQYKINEFESALDSVETATRSGFDDVDAWTSKAFFINILDGDPLVEADAARAALRVDSGNVNGMVKLGEALLRQGLMDEAVASFEAATRQVTSEETKRDYPDAALLGWSHLRLRHYDEALELLTASLAMDGFDTGDQFDLALALLCSGRDEVAMGEYEAGTVRLRAETHEGRRRSLVRVATHDMDAFIRDGQLTEGETVQAIRHLLVHAVAEVDPA